MLLRLLLLNFLFVKILFGFNIESEIYPLITEFQQIEKLNPHKYSKEQFKMLSETVSFREHWIRVVTYNILFDTNDDQLEFEDRWPQRRAKICQLIRLINPDILCVQELKKIQLEYFMKTIGDVYAFYGNPVISDGDIDGVFFRKSRFGVLDKSTLPIGLEDARHALTRITLFDNQTQKSFSVFNTHLPYLSCEARLHSAKQIIGSISSASAHSPVIFTGDLNTIPQRLDLRELPFYDGDYVINTIKGSVLQDSFDCSILGHLGPISTYTNAPESNNGIPFRGTGVPGIVLDRIFTTKDILVIIHATEAAQIDGRFPSDHLPVIVDLVIP